MKPGFFTNEHLAELSPWHRLCFAGLWTLADREGRLEDRPRRIKAALFPYDDLDIDGLLNGLSEKGFIVRYVADGVPCIAIPTFERHQRPKSDELPSALPAPLFDDPRRKAVPPRTYKGDRGQGDREERTEGGGADGAPIATDVVDFHLDAADGADHRRDEDVQELWNITTNPPIPRCRELTAKRRRHIKARNTELTWGEWRQVFTKIAASAFCNGHNDRGWTASFDWVIGSPDVAIKVLEGKYDDRLSRGKATPRVAGCRHVRPCADQMACTALCMSERKVIPA